MYTVYVNSIIKLYILFHYSFLVKMDATAPNLNFERLYSHSLRDLCGWLKAVGDSLKGMRTKAKAIAK